MDRSSSNRKRIGFGAAASDTGEIIVGLVDGLADVAAEEIPVCVAETLFAAGLQRTPIRVVRHRRGEEVALQRGGVDDAFRARGAEHLVDGFEVYGCEGADVETHFLEGCWVEFLRFCCDGRFFAHDDLACRSGVCGEQPPIHIPPVAQIGVVGFLGGPFEDLWHEVLALGRPLDEEFDGGSEESKLDLNGLVGEREEEVLEEDVAVFNTVGVLADNPDHGSLGFGLVERVEVLAKRADDGFILVWVLTEDVADHDCGFLYDIGHFGGDELQKRVNAATGGRLDFDGEFADCTDGLADEVDVDFGSISVEVSVEERRRGSKRIDREKRATHSRSSVRTSSILSSFASIKISSSFVTLT